MPKEENSPTSFRISEDGKDLLQQIAAHYGLNRTGVLEMLIRQEARKIGVKKKAGANP